MQCSGRGPAELVVTDGTARDASARPHDTLYLIPGQPKIRHFDEPDYQRVLPWWPLYVY